MPLTTGALPADFAAEGEVGWLQYGDKAARKRGKASQLTQERRQKEGELAALQQQAQSASNEAARKEAQLDAHRGTPLRCPARQAVCFHRSAALLCMRVMSHPAACAVCCVMDARS